MAVELTPAASVLRPIESDPSLGRQCVAADGCRIDTAGKAVEADGQRPVLVGLRVAAADGGRGSARCGKLRPMAVAPTSARPGRCCRRPSGRYPSPKPCCRLPLPGPGSHLRCCRPAVAPTPAAAALLPMAVELTSRRSRIVAEGGSSGLGRLGVAAHRRRVDTGSGRIETDRHRPCLGRLRVVADRRLAVTSPVTAWRPPVPAPESAPPPSVMPLSRWSGSGRRS